MTQENYPNSITKLNRFLHKLNRHKKTILVASLNSIDFYMTQENYPSSITKLNRFLHDTRKLS